jgi:hypothetical protein
VSANYVCSGTERKRICGAASLEEEVSHAVDIPKVIDNATLVSIQEGTVGPPGETPLQEDFYHVGLAVSHMETAMEAIGALLGAEWTSIAEIASPNVYSRDGLSGSMTRRAHSRGLPIPLELLQGTPGSTWDTDQLAVPHHLAYWTRDVAAEVSKFVERGWELELTLLDEAQSPTEVAYLTKTDAVRIELVAVERRAAYLQLVSGR